MNTCVYTHLTKIKISHHILESEVSDATDILITNNESKILKNQYTRWQYFLQLIAYHIHIVDIVYDTLLYNCLYLLANVLVISLSPWVSSTTFDKLE